MPRAISLERPPQMHFPATEDESRAWVDYLASCPASGLRSLATRPPFVGSPDRWSSISLILYNAPSVTAAFLRRALPEGFDAADFWGNVLAVEMGNYTPFPDPARKAILGFMILSLEESTSWEQGQDYFALAAARGQISASDPGIQAFLKEHAVSSSPQVLEPLLYLNDLGASTAKMISTLIRSSARGPSANTPRPDLDVLVSKKTRLYPYQILGMLTLVGDERAQLRLLMSFFLDGEFVSSMGSSATLISLLPLFSSSRPTVRAFLLTSWLRSLEGQALEDTLVSLAASPKGLPADAFAAFLKSRSLSKDALFSSHTLISLAASPDRPVRDEALRMLALSRSARSAR